jgi:hypothetical protein
VVLALIAETMARRAVPVVVVDKEPAEALRFIQAALVPPIKGSKAVTQTYKTARAAAAAVVRAALAATRQSRVLVVMQVLVSHLTSQAVRLFEQSVAQVKETQLTATRRQEGRHLA